MSEDLKSVIIEAYNESLSGSEYFENPVTEKDAQALIDFIDNELPKIKCRLPELSCDPRGYLGLEWYNENKDILLLVFQDDKLIYACSLTDTSSHGSVPVSEGLPDLIVGVLEERFT